MTRQILLLLSGKRACGKDFFSRRIHKFFTEKNLNVSKFSIGAEIKRKYAETHGLSYTELIKNRKFKEQHRESLIKLSESMNGKNEREKLLVPQLQSCSTPVVLITD